MDVSGIKSAQLAVSGVLAGEIDDTEKSKVINRQEDTSHSEKIIEELGERYNRENTKITKPQLNGKPAGKQHDDKISAKKISISELFSLLSDNLSGEQIKSSGINQSINNNIMKNIWSEKKESDLSEDINNYAGILLGCVDELSERYFSVINNCDEMFDDIRLFFTEDKNIKINSKDEFSVFFNRKLGVDIVLKSLSEKGGDAGVKTALLENLLNDIISLPEIQDQMWVIEPQKLALLTSELNTLNTMAGVLASAKECLSAAQSLISMNNKNTVEYNNSLAVLMGKLADLRDQIAQKKLENDRELARLQQLALQVKTDKDAADIAEKIKKAERLQALFKWLGPLLTAIMAVLTALTGGLMAKALAAVIVIMTIVSEVVKAAGGPDIMAKIMEPVTKLVEVIQKFIKEIAMEIAKAQGKSPEELKKPEKTMEIVGMVLAVVVVMALFIAAASAGGAIAGKITGKFASEAMQAAMKSAFAQIQTMLTTLMMTTTIINSASSVTNGVLQADIVRHRADMDVDLVLMDRITELMNQIMAAFSESQKELIALNEKLSKYGNDSFQRIKSMLQQGQQAV
ncbi:type III secretion system translocon subunit SctE [Morganella morganii]|uniref:Type III secretion system translocon subunit SctE n=1 Tax=Morganella morganii TaxID=582 RepID=A0A9Q4CNW1_MORMO|nr:type III secretion system translocon subunit SctE [Morganella morganii]MCY0789904.1 type III secretion system translocon subunit SctE [Morganella morganii]